ncbi:serpin family protein [Streptomyces sp. AM6-12]|uniref:serpin family protein n=1 Tax=Streptomyces sp. AM6-12 TaxID=3345149 RepID=UPI00379620CC
MKLENGVDGTVVRTVNGLTARWGATARGGTAFSAAGVWPLLALLADGAAGPARQELAGALGVPAEQAGALARELLAALGSVSGLDTALGLWTQADLLLREEWLAALPPGTHGVFGEDLVTAQERLDRWAAERTGGLVERMPVTLNRQTRMVLAGALALHTTWRQPFTEQPLTPAAGPWQGRTLRGLHRRSVRPDRVGVAGTQDGFVTALTVPGDSGIDVHLVLGEERMTPGQVIAAGVAVVERALALTPGGALPYGEVGPGLRVEREQAHTPEPTSLDVRTVAYEVRADHDLLAQPELFGLRSATDARFGHFPGVSAHPLTVSEARQSAVTRFGALGFRAAAVTAVAEMYGSAPPRYRYETTVVRVAFDRPFAFLAVDRDSRLVLLSGWVTDPAPYPAPGYAGTPGVRHP